MAICKRMFGNESNFNNIFKKWIPEIAEGGEKDGIAEKEPKTIDEIALEVIDGKWYHGAARKSALTKAGYNYDEVQKRVNELRSEEK